MNRQLAVRGLAVADGKMLCVKHTPYRERANQDDYWCLPGGNVESGESVTDALTRELVEETGVKPVVGPLIYVQQYKDSQNERLEFIFLVTNAADYRSVDLSKTSHGQQEIAQIEFIDPSTETVLPKFLTTEKLDDLANQPTKFFSYL